MTPKKIYENCCRSLQTSFSQGDFCNMYNESVNELLSMYPKKILFDGGGEYVPIGNVDETTALKTVFSQAVTKNILYLKTGEKSYKEQFFAIAINAYHTVWAESSKGGKIGRGKRNV